MAKFFIVAAILALATQAFAAPADEVTEVARTTYLCKPPVVIGIHVHS